MIANPTASPFHGIWVPLVTPFAGEAVDYAGVQRLARHYIDAGVDGLVVCGTTGEPATLSPAERLGVLDAVLEVAAGCPVVMGVSGNDTRGMCVGLDSVQQRAIAGLLIAAPYYVRPSQEGLRQHFLALAEAAAVPIVVYNIPYRTGVAIEFDTFRALAEHPRIQAVKDCGGSLLLTMDLIAHTPLAILAGEDAHIGINHALGGAGAIAAAVHIRPELWVRLWRLLEAGEQAAANTLFYAMLPLIRLLFAEPNPAPVKALLAQQGLIADGALRLPMTPASAALQARLVTALAELDAAV